jgi:TQXA domain-containing protein/LPXTG-motif cell wall-anchored protein
VSRLKNLRRGAALIGVTATALLAAVIPAAADAATGTVGSVGKSGPSVKVKFANGDVREYETKLFKLKVGDTELLTYCVDIHTDIYPDKKPSYVEVPWNQHPKDGSQFNENADKISWLLHNGYPTLSEKEIAAKLPDVKFTDGLSAEEALAATQAAAWHFSDGVSLYTEDATPKNPKSAVDVQEVYNYLTGKANVGIKEQPKPELNLEPKKISGKPGTLIGPFVVSTTGKDLLLNATLPAGVKLTDKDGNELPKADAAKKLAATDKYEFYVKVPAEITEGKAEITISGSATLTLGRLFVSPDPKKSPSQSLILAKNETVSLQTKGEANWNVAATTPPATDTPAPQPKNTAGELANTGASIVTPIVIGVVLVGAGVGALVFPRRRRRA